MTQKENKKADKNIFQSILEMPITRVLLVGAGLVGLVFVSSHVFRIVGSAVSNYKGMVEAIRK